MPVVTCIDDLRELARRRVARAIFEYVDCGSYSECTLRANVADLEAIGLRQRVGIDVDRRSTRTTMLGHDVAMPVALAPIGGIFALYFTGTHFSVSSGVGFLALFGVAVETGVIMIEYINQLRARGYSIHEAALEGAVRRLRPIMMTMLVATLGLLPAAISNG